MKVLPPAASPDSNWNVANYMHHNIPIAIILAQTAFNNEVFKKLDEECTSGDKAAIIVIFLFLTFMGLIWVIVKCRSDYIHNYPHAISGWRWYAAIQSVVMIISFYSINYYTHEGVPFNCFFEYNATASQIMFWMSFVLVATISYMEHAYWKKLNIIVPLMSEHNLES